jgi:hypothetical protein
MASVPGRRIVRTRAWWACVLAVIFMVVSIALYLFDRSPSTILEESALWAKLSFALFAASFIIQT